MPKVREHVAVMLNKEMDRKQFLQYSGFVFLAAFGISGFINAFVANTKSRVASSTPAPMKGYGSSRFGKS